jgi:hypothetical protein
MFFSHFHMPLPPEKMDVFQPLPPEKTDVFQPLLPKKCTFFSHFHLKNARFSATST